MLSAGIDIGTKTIKIVVVKAGHVEARTIAPVGFDVKESLQNAWQAIGEQSGIKARDIEKITAIGTGCEAASLESSDIMEIEAAARGVMALDPSVRTIIDVGAEESRAVKVDENGMVIDSAVNEKCAAGAGAFTEAMARALDVSLEELGPLSLQSTQAVAMNAQCAVFAESDLVTLIHARTPKPDMARAIHDAMAEWIASMVRRVGIEHNVMLIGGLAYNVGFVTSLNRELRAEIMVPESPDFVSAYGAALIAAEL